jgi:integrase
MKIALTDRFCDRVKAETQTDYFDDKVQGLALRVTPNGVKAWSLLYTESGRKVRVTLGRYPAVSLASARALALEAKSLGPRHGPMTVADLVESYISKRAPSLRSGDQMAHRLRRDVSGVIGSVRLSELHRRDATRVIDAVLGRGATTQAAMIFDNLRTVLRWAVARGDLDHNPIDGMVRPASGEPRDRVLSDDEIRNLWSHPRLPFPRVLRLCLLTAQRIGEVCGMVASELDVDAKVWTIPGSRTKNAHSHSVPLTDAALALIGDRFDGFGVTAKTVSNTIAQNQLGLAHWTAHDLRRSALTGMAKLGIEPIVLAHVANHRTGTRAGMTLSVYVHHAYEAEKRRALQLWADRVRRISAGAELVPMRRR